MHEIEQFVRDRLGCRCPPEVFRSITIDPQPELEAFAPGCRSISVGRRLLVLVWPLPGRPTLDTVLPELLRRGRRLRDERGFNRLRLVVASDDPSSARQWLVPQFTEVAGSDERVHLHVIHTYDLPSL